VACWSRGPKALRQGTRREDLLLAGERALPQPETLFRFRFFLLRLSFFDPGHFSRIQLFVAEPLLTLKALDQGWALSQLLHLA
jgi:hypothetical protein